MKQFNTTFTVYTNDELVTFTIPGKALDKGNITVDVAQLFKERNFSDDARVVYVRSFPVKGGE